MPPFSSQVLKVHEILLKVIPLTGRSTVASKELENMLSPAGVEEIIGHLKSESGVVPPLVWAQADDDAPSGDKASVKETSLADNTPKSKNGQLLQRLFVLFVVLDQQGLSYLIDILLKFVHEFSDINTPIVKERSRCYGVVKKLIDENPQSKGKAPDNTYLAIAIARLFVPRQTEIVQEVKKIDCPLVVCHAFNALLFGVGVLEGKVPDRLGRPVKRALGVDVPNFKKGYREFDQLIKKRLQQLKQFSSTSAGLVWWSRRGGLTLRGVYAE